MPAPTDYLGLAYAQIWTLLEADAEFAAYVKPGNRIKLSGGKANPFKDQLAEGDLPQAALTLAPNVAMSGYERTRQYAYTASAPGIGQANAPAAVVEVSVTFTLDVITRSLDGMNAGLILASVYRALLAGGPRWGLEWLVKWGPVDGNWTAINAGSGGVEGPDPTPRTRLKLNIPVTIRMTRTFI